MLLVPRVLGAGTQGGARMVCRAVVLFWILSSSSKVGFVAVAMVVVVMVRVIKIGPRRPSFRILLSGSGSR